MRRGNGNGEHLTDKELAVVDKLIRGDLEVERGGALADPP